MSYVDDNNRSEVEGECPTCGYAKNAPTTPSCDLCGAPRNRDRPSKGGRASLAKLSSQEAKRKVCVFCGLPILSTNCVKCGEAKREGRSEAVVAAIGLWQTLCGVWTVHLTLTLVYQSRDLSPADVPAVEAFLGVPLGVFLGGVMALALLTMVGGLGVIGRQIWGRILVIATLGLEILAAVLLDESGLVIVVVMCLKGIILGGLFLPSQDRVFHIPAADGEARDYLPWRTPTFWRVVGVIVMVNLVAEAILPDT